MPLYEFTCQAGHRFERRAGYGTDVASCVCGEPAHRAAFYRQQGIVVEGRSIPPPSDSAAVQEEWFKEVKKAGWTGERAKEELRASIFEDNQGRRYFDTSKLARES